MLTLAAFSTALFTFVALSIGLRVLLHVQYFADFSKQSSLLLEAQPELRTQDHAVSAFATRFTVEQYEEGLP